ncbi:MAG: hypothetical protein R3D60_13170 [Paracoccaceae bacterium]
MTPLPPRLPGWRSRLYAWLDASAKEPHVFGRHDCALIIAGGIEAMHGVDPAAPYRGRYTSWRGGLRILRRAGFEDPRALLATLATPVAPISAQIGDIAVLEGEGHINLGFVVGSQIRVLRSDGSAILPLFGPFGCAAHEVWRT